MTKQICFSIIFFFKRILLKSCFFLLLTLNTNAENLTIKCYIDENKSFSFLINTTNKEILWLDENNQKLKIIVFPDLKNIKSRTIIAARSSEKKENHVFVIDTVKAVFSVTTNTGYNKGGSCGNKAIFNYENNDKE